MVYVLGLMPVLVVGLNSRQSPISHIQWELIAQVAPKIDASSKVNDIRTMVTRIRAH